MIKWVYQSTQDFKNPDGTPASKVSTPKISEIHEPFLIDEQGAKWTPTGIITDDNGNRWKNPALANTPADAG